MVETRVHFKVVTWISFDLLSPTVEDAVKFCDRAKADPKVLKDTVATHKMNQDYEEVKEYIVENKEA